MMRSFEKRSSLNHSQKPPTIAPTPTPTPTNCESIPNFCPVRPKKSVMTETEYLIEQYKELSSKLIVIRNKLYQLGIDSEKLN